MMNPHPAITGHVLTERMEGKQYLMIVLTGLSHIIIPVSGSLINMHGNMSLGFSRTVADAERGALD